MDIETKVHEEQQQLAAEEWKLTLEEVSFAGCLVNCNTEEMR